MNGDPMNEQPQPTPVQPEQGIIPPAQPQPVAHSSKARTIWAIVLLTAPTALFILLFIVGAISNYAFASATPADGSLYAETSAAQSIINILIFLLGAVAFLAWLPGIIIGIILLATKK